MPRRRDNSCDTAPDWFLVEWMRTVGTTQAKLARETGWSKATMHAIFHGKTAYYRDILNEAARALNILPYELLMSPSEAMALRRMRESAVRIASDTPIPYIAEPKAASG